MIKELIEHLKNHKEDFAPTKEYMVQMGYCTTCWSTDYVYINDLDMDSLFKAIEEFSKTFQQGGENSHRNPMNKE